METIAEDIGWIKAHVERLIANQLQHEVEHAALAAKLSSIEDQISIYKTIIKTVQFIAAAILLLLTFKFGDVTTLWHRIFN